LEPIKPVKPIKPIKLSKLSKPPKPPKPFPPSPNLAIVQKTPFPHLYGVEKLITLNQPTMETVSIRQRSFLLFFMCALLAFMPGCTKNDVDDPTDPDDPSNPGGSKKRTVYVAGSELTGNYLAATYWVYGEMKTVHHLTDGSRYAEALGVHVSGDDVYVLGRVLGPSTYQIKYWKNGVAFEVTDGVLSAEPGGIFVDKNTVYTVGSEFDGTEVVAKYWTGRASHDLTDGKNRAHAASIYVLNGDVYTCGYERKNGKDVAKYWKNKTETALTNGDNNSYAQSIFVSGNDVYVTGSESKNGIAIAKYWKNGVPVTLGAGVGASQGTCIRVSGNDVYVSGNENSQAMVWKNGKAIASGGGFITHSLALVGSDYYTAGFSHAGGDNYSAIASKSAYPLDLLLNGKKSSAMSVFVTEK
jgi:hypothetical protein